MLLRLFVVCVILMSFSTHGNAWQVVGKLPPSTHTVELGTYVPYESMAGARRYFLIEETDESICKSPKLVTQPSPTFIKPASGLYKYFKSPTGARTPYPVAFITECQIPESEEPNVPPPPPPVNFVGLSRISINPTPTDPNTCTFLEWKIAAKNIDDTYTMQILRWFDASQMINGARVCPYK